jgi:hypothetical protein
MNLRAVEINQLEWVLSSSSSSIINAPQKDEKVSSKKASIRQENNIFVYATYLQVNIYRYGLKSKLAQSDCELHTLIYTFPLKNLLSHFVLSFRREKCELRDAIYITPLVKWEFRTNHHLQLALISIAPLDSYEYFFHLTQPTMIRYCQHCAVRLAQLLGFHDILILPQASHSSA